jgi:hypothetical protein
MALGFTIPPGVTHRAVKLASLERLGQQRNVRWDGPAVPPAPPAKEAGKGTKDEEHAMSAKFNSEIAVIGIDIGKNSFHVPSRQCPCGVGGRSRGWGQYRMAARADRRT